jgi:1,4-alpha-glucan branching enzyme
MLNKMFGSYDEKFSTLRALYGFQYGHPGKKLLFMGGEFGQFIEWDYKRELDWFLLEYPRHLEMQRYVRELNRFYAAHPAMYALDTGWDGFTWLNVDDSKRSSVAFMRVGGGERVVCAYNFTPNSWDFQVALPRAGELVLCLNSDEYRFGGTGMELAETVRSQAVPFREFSHSAVLTLPPLSATYYIFKEDKA